MKAWKIFFLGIRQKVDEEDWFWLGLQIFVGLPILVVFITPLVAVGWMVGKMWK